MVSVAVVVLHESQRPISVLECFISPNLPLTYQEAKKGGSRGQGSGFLLHIRCIKYIPHQLYSVDVS
ncbi:unnamed protein product [Calypogeia fissa]